jgi:rod shape-determining protein MreD
MPRTSLIIGLSLVCLLLQTTIVPSIAIVTIVPDLVLIWIVYVAITRGQIQATTVGFFLGLSLDVFSGGDSMLGLSALTKTMAGFLAGYTYNENKITQYLGGPQFPLILIAVSLVHNLLYFVIFLQGSDILWSAAILQFGLPTTLYTAAVALLPVFVFYRHFRT